MHVPLDFFFMWKGPQLSPFELLGPKSLWSGAEREKNIFFVIPHRVPGSICNWIGPQPGPLGPPGPRPLKKYIYFVFPLRVPGSMCHWKASQLGPLKPLVPRPWNGALREKNIYCFFPQRIPGSTGDSEISGALRASGVFRISGAPGALIPWLFSHKKSR